MKLQIFFLFYSFLYRSNVKVCLKFIFFKVKQIFEQDWTSIKYCYFSNNRYVHVGVRYEVAGKLDKMF